MMTSAPAHAPAVSLDETLERRRSTREFAPRPLTDAEVRRLLWAGQGVTDAEGRRTAPSAGAQFGIELYAVTPSGVLHYEPATDDVAVIAEGSRRAELQAAAAGQECVGQAPVTIVIAGVVSRLEARYGGHALGYLLLEAGHVGQNILLEAVALELGAVPCAKFDADAVASVAGLPAGQVPLEIIPVGHPKE
jgi:SagB-type dehydrogenase family enzyme